MRLQLLRELRDLRRRQARTNSILSFEGEAFSKRAGVSPDAVQDALTDLLAEGLAEPYMATLGQSAEDGACRITSRGMAALRDQSTHL